MSAFKFKLGDQAKIISSGETGKIVGRAEYTNTENGYYLHYQKADGGAVSQWWDASFLEAVLACQEQPEVETAHLTSILASMLKEVCDQPIAEVPKCMQCRHFAKAGIHERFDRCLHPRHGVDPVRGLPMAPACELLRYKSCNQTCGKAGQWFEASTA